MKCQRAFLFLQIVASGLEHRFQGDQADDLRTRHPCALFLRQLTNFLEHVMREGNVRIGEVHRHLRDMVVRQVPTGCLAGFEQAGNLLALTFFIPHDLPLLVT
ncbi:hypothetical protein BMS3Bbin04_01500 [bacterium BMS3Bbin04]|nr:hypothetical protein BMS3Bbin04_01500 [bacterium BMS3Bbin04]